MENKKMVSWIMTALFAGIIIAMSFTPIGYLKIGVIEMSLIPIIVAVGAIVIGPAAGAVLGTVFGLTSFYQCFGLSAFGAALLDLNPFYTFIICLVPRVLMGLFSGLVFKGLQKVDKTKLLSYAAGSVVCALTNTVLFVGLLILFFGNSDYILGLRAGSGLLAFAVGFVGINGLIEAVVCLFAGTAISKPLRFFVSRQM